MDNFSTVLNFELKYMKQLFRAYSGIDDSMPFQTGLSFKKKKRVTNFLINQIDEEYESDSDDEDKEDEENPLNFHLTLQYAYMIRSEKIFYQRYAVFYRQVRKQYIVYEIYSLLFWLTQNPSVSTLDAMLKQDKVALDWKTVCSNSILKSDYARDMNQLIEGVGFDGISDMHSSYISLLSAHCTLKPRDSESEFSFNYQSKKETGVFWEGYEENNLLKICITTLFSQIFHVHDSHIRDQKYTEIEAAFKTHCAGKRGHMIQIFVPLEVVDEFAYPSIEYGYKVDIFLMKNTKMISEISRLNDKYKRFPHIEPSEIARAVPFSELLRTKYLDRVQARIYGHPDLYLKKGAHCRIYHGSPGFDYLAFRHTLVSILSPWLRTYLETKSMFEDSSILLI